MNDVVVKWLVTALPASEIVGLRAVAVLFAIPLIAQRDGGVAAIRIRNYGGQLLQASLSVVAMLMFVLGLRTLPLADAIALLFAGPLMATVLAATILHEPVGWRRWLAVAAGFVGVIIILRPGGEGFTWAAMLPIGGAAAGALRDIVTRRLCTSESSSSILLVTAVVMIASTLLTAQFGWVWPSRSQFGLVLLAGLALSVALYLNIESLRFGDVGLVSPFRYSTMVWAVLFGYLFFDTIPDRWVSAGSGLVIASGLYILHREWTVNAGKA